jgi:hypothetical protein
MGAVSKLRLAFDGHWCTTPDLLQPDSDSKILAALGAPGLTAQDETLSILLPFARLRGFPQESHALWHRRDSFQNW